MANSLQNMITTKLNFTSNKSMFFIKLPAQGLKEPSKILVILCTMYR